MTTPVIALIFDVETTGLLNMRVPLPSTLDSCPYVLQFSYLMYDITNKKLIKSVDNYIKIPDTVNIPENAAAVNGITREMCETGKPIVEILKEFYNDYHCANKLVAHNYKYDSRMLTIEMKRNWHLLKKDYPYALNLFDPIYMKNIPMKYVCTMDSCTNLCQIKFPDNDPNKPIRYKWPTLLQLHFHLFQYEPENLHNSLIDCMVCLRCYLKVFCDYVLDEESFKSMSLDVLI